MNPTHARELLERAAASVTPTESDPTSRLVSLGRRSVQRRRRAWKTAGSVAVAAVLAAVVALPLRMAAPDRSEAAGEPGTTVSLGGLSVAVPEGWRTSEVTTFDPCIAEPHTVYLAARWYPTRPRSRPPGSTLVKCKSEGQAWIAVVQKGVAPSVGPDRLVVKDGQLLQVEQPDPYMIPSMWTYRAFSDEIQATTAFISGDEKGREQLIKRVTWPAGPAAPASGGLVLPDRIANATTNVPPTNGMVVATDAKTLNQIRTTLAELRDPVPAGEECTLQTPGPVGISLGEVTVVLGDATCPQAISTGGGRVRVPAGLGKELLDLIVASDRAATERATKD
ncbi:hypothetical protein SAMN05444365_1119 [Micromonospora pattaloongensis]|uniref:Uncharacterized protein n=1 Tax=Micromonospora pattaloongensis TaxID=405436 RepID=A0A1H3SAF6_9ACTN|nr:hypothetical protein [Micromonospora pattaloongensis]SDZ35083.1 hypothetical protein SAMN05444365_1119 [Micromonospora pattaloongensis]